MDLISIPCLVLIYLSAAWCGLIKQPALFFYSAAFQHLSALWLSLLRAAGRNDTRILRMNFSSILRVYYTTFLRLCQAFLHGF